MFTTYKTNRDRITAEQARIAAVLAPVTTYARNRERLAAQKRTPVNATTYRSGSLGRVTIPE